MNIKPARNFYKEKNWTRILPKESKKLLLNPHKGIATFQRFNGEELFPPMKPSDAAGPVTFKHFNGNTTNVNYPQTTVAYCRWYWEMIEPEKGRYRWDIIDGALEAARVRGQSLQVGLMPISADNNKGALPQWYKAIAPTEKDKVKKEVIAIPFYDGPDYLHHWGDLIRAFAARYDEHKDLETFDLSFIGPWGEGAGRCSEEGVRRMVDLYCDAFFKTPLLSLIGHYQYEYGMVKGNGWRADCFGDVTIQNPLNYPCGWNHMYDFYPREVCLRGGSEAWRTEPVVMESCWVPGHWEAKDFDVDWIIEQGLKYHTSVFMPKSCPMSVAMVEKMNEFAKRMGYRFVLRQFTVRKTAKRGGFLPYIIWIENVGVAPIYRRYDFALRFRQGKTKAVVKIQADITKWLLGDHWLENELLVPRSLQPGKVALDIALVDKQTPRVQFAIEDYRTDGWYPMTTIELT